VELSLPDSLTAIGDSVFHGCSGFTKLSLPDSLTAIGDRAFHGCHGLVELSLPDSLTAIGEEAFDSCSGLVELSLPDSLTAIGDRAFDGCFGLAELSLPKSLTQFGRWAFRDCINLRSLTLSAAGDFLGATGICQGSTHNLRMLVVPVTIPAIDATKEARLSRNVHSSFNHNAGESEFGLRAMSNIQVVCAPDTVVATLGGVFAGMTTMAEVRAAGRAISGVVEQRYWTVGTHRHHVCTRGQRACAHTLMLVGARLYSRSTPSSAMAPVPLLGVTARGALPLLPPLPDELWLLVLGWVRRSELGRRL
jgi:hypothetical protein